MEQDKFNAHSLFNQGLDVHQAGHLKEAIELWKWAKAIYLRIGFSEGIAKCDKSIGVTLESIGQPEQAIDHFEQARAAYHQLGFDKEVADCEACNWSHPRGSSQTTAASDKPH